MQGESQIWVAGKSKLIADFLRRRQSSLITGFKLWNVNIVSLAVFGMIVVMPSFEPLAARVAFGVVVAEAVLILNVTHAKFIPASMTSMGDKKPSLLRFWPSWVSWVFGIISAVVVIQLAARIDEWAKTRSVPPSPSPVASTMEPTVRKAE